MAGVFLAIGFSVVLIDQVIKFIVQQYLPQAGTVTAIPYILDLTYVENKGVAFGMFKDMRWLFVIFTAVIIVVIFYVVFYKDIESKLFYIASGLIVGGGIGNLIDRLNLGYVIDYLQLSFFSPVCNFADYAITVGTVLLIIYLLFFSDFSKSERKKEKGND